MNQITEVLLQYKSFKNKWNAWLESGEVIEVTRFAQELDVKCKVVFTNELFKEMFPYAEEAVKSISFQERLEEMFGHVKRSAEFSILECLNFDLKTETNIKKVHGYNSVETLAHGKKTDKVTSVFAGRIVDDKGNPAIIFGIADGF